MADTDTSVVTLPAPPSTAARVIEVAQIAATVAEAVPGAGAVVMAFDPLITLVLAIARAHFNATGKFPDESAVTAALPVSYRQVVAGWASWKPSGDGTLPQGQ